MAANGDSRFGERIATEADHWHSRMLEPASEAEVEAFEAWLNADPAHARAYAESEAVSTRAAGLPQRLLHPQTPAQGHRRLRPAFGLAAAVAILVTGGLWFASQSMRPAHAAISNPGPAIRGVRLGDGSAIILDAGTELAVDFGRDARVVTLRKGRARFNVAHETNRPFSVITGSATVTARSTLFDVALIRKKTRIWVITGNVDLAAAGSQDNQSFALRSGQSASVSDGRVTTGTVEPAHARWPAARLAFDDVPLSTIVARANRGGGPPIRLGDDSIGALRVTGVLDIRDTRPLARKLAPTFDLHVEERPDEILLTR